MFKLNYYITEKSQCYINPCLNGGKCTETEDGGFVCNCTETFYRGKTCNHLLIVIDDIGVLDCCAMSF